MWQAKKLFMNSEPFEFYFIENWEWNNSIRHYFKISIAKIHKLIINWKKNAFLFIINWQ